LLADAVVPGCLQSTNRRLLHGGDSPLYGDWRPRVRAGTRTGRGRGDAGMAMAVHPGSRAGAGSVRYRVLLPDRPAGRGDMAAAGGARVARVASGAGAKA